MRSGPAARAHPAAPLHGWGAGLRAPVGDDAVLDGVLEREDAALGLRLVTHVRVLLAHAHHHTLQPPRPQSSPLLLVSSGAVPTVSAAMLWTAEQQDGHGSSMQLSQGSAEPPQVAPICRLVRPDAGCCCSSGAARWDAHGLVQCIHA